MRFDADRLRDIARAQTAGDAQAGASLCVIVGGEEVFCESWGMADAARQLPYTQDSMQLLMSTGKGVMGTLLAVLIDRGLLDPGERVAKYWPEFAAAGKRDITVAQLFSHQAGLPLLEGNLTLALLADRPALADAFARQAPLWEPGSAHGYHAMTLGCLADILFERAAGKDVNGLLAELAPQMGAQLHSGLPREHAQRAVQILPPLPDAQAAAPVPDPASLAFRVLTNLPEMLGSPQQFWNGEAIHDVSLPGTNMFGSARGLAHLYAGLAGGGVWQGRRLCSAQAIAAATTEKVRGIDLVNGAEMAYGLCFQMPSAYAPFSPNRAAYGHCGVGGSVAFADPRRGLALAWIPSRFSAQTCDRRMLSIIDAVYAST